jgi:glycerol-3-phosphate O-acyltransferase
MVAWDDEEGVAVPSDENARRHATLRLAHRIVYGINRCTAVTPTALAASALLGSGRRGVARKTLIEEARFLLSRARENRGRMSEALVDARGALNLDALDRALDLLERDGDVQVRGGSAPSADTTRPLDQIYTIPDERRPRLTYYRNNAVHLYVADAQVCLALRSLAKAGKDRIVERDDLHARTLRVSRLLKLEFAYRVGETFESIFEGTVAGLVAAGVLADDAEGLRARLGQEEHVALLAGQVQDFVESYWIVARALEAVSAPSTEKELLKRVQDLGERLFLTGDVKRREACQRTTYQNALAWFRERGFLVEEAGKLRVTGEVARVAAETAELLG